MRDYNELKTRIISAKAVTESNMRTLEININKFKDYIDSISESSKIRMREAGLELSVLDNIDYNRLKTDSNYIKYINKEIETIIIKCASIVEGRLND